MPPVTSGLVPALALSSERPAQKLGHQHWQLLEDSLIFIIYFFAQRSAETTGSVCYI